ncbi:hypothetical protein ACU4GH_18130 [Bradyrhizobium betae]
MNSGRADFGNRISGCEVSGIPSHGTRAPVSRQSAKTTPCTVADASRNNELRGSDFVYPETALTRRAKQEQNGIIATIAGVDAVPVKGASTRLCASAPHRHPKKRNRRDGRRTTGFARREASRACAGKGHIA